MAVFWIILVALLCDEYNTHVYGKSQPPRIIPSDTEYIVAPNQDFILKCESQDPIIWQLPNNTIDETMFKYSTITTEQWINLSSPYGSILTIHNASYLDTGFYRCMSNTTNINDRTKVTSLYLYVEDPEQLSVTPEFPESINVEQYAPVILPCRPTSPTVRVELEQATGEEVVLDVMDEDGTIVTLDKRYGFQINQVDKSGARLFDCIFSKGPIRTRSTLFLDVQRKTTSIAKPVIEEISGGHTTVGEKLVLRCIFKTDLVTFSMNWIVPDQKGLNNGRINVSKSRLLPNPNERYYREYFQDLIIENTTIDDQGDYTCLVQDYTHKNNNTKTVKIFRKGENVINLVE